MIGSNGVKTAKIYQLSKFTFGMHLRHIQIYEKNDLKDAFSTFAAEKTTSRKTFPSLV
uniref:Uncharacterized protein n=1 Tax=Rhizophora mucronata TaxID=61149 RepID=A0A2P2N8B6_RHIMU